jgi:Ca2+-binding RTX toxin-like protein
VIHWGHDGVFDAANLLTGDGNDSLTGGACDDTFYFDDGFWQDTITDFAWLMLQAR